MTYDAFQTSQYGGEPMTLFRFASGSSRVWLLTSERQPVLRGSETYVPEAIRHGSFEQTVGESPRSFDITVPSSTDIAQQFKAFLPAQPISVIVYSRHRPDAEYVPVFIGECSSGSTDTDGITTITCEPIGYKLSRNIPWPRYCSQCNWAVYSLGCGVSREAFKTVANVTSANGFEISAAAFDAFENGWFNAGFVVRDLTGETRWVVAHIDATLTLVSPFPDFGLGESVTAYAGCDGLESTCSSKFNNLPNHAGFPDVPTKNPYRDNVFGTGTPAGGGTDEAVRAIFSGIKG